MYLSLPLLLPHLTNVIATGVELTSALEVSARTRSTGAACPRCGSVSRRVHSRYLRQLADTAMGGRPVLIKLQVRRLFCATATCPAVTFAEQVPGLTSRMRVAPRYCAHCWRESVSRWPVAQVPGWPRTWA
ncbi:transposase family protein [Actinopolymorpha pittospori]|uniref:transposase family protein n=1 Tax=Actinopolymorpha pittospori TaxID=648752 RepID=UPI00337312EF